MTSIGPVRLTALDPTPTAARTLAPSLAGETGVPAGLLYTTKHEWLQITDGVATIGITAFAAQALGDVVFLQVPSVGTALAAGEACGEIESTKSVSDLYCPADGEVAEINEAAVAQPELVSSDPFGVGWLFKLTLQALPELLDAAAYTALTSGDQ